MPHPAVLIFLWVCLTIAMQSLQANLLLLAGVPLMIAAYALSAERLFTLLRRTRWIMLSLLIIYAYATPGVAVWSLFAQFSPTHEGLIDGVLQLCRLAFALAGLAILLGLLSQPELIGGLYTLAYPLHYFGLSRERIAVRLALTLHYAESAMLDTSVNWRSAIEHMLVAEGAPPASRPLEERASGGVPFTGDSGGVPTGVPLAGTPGAVTQNSIELHTIPFTLRDGLLLIMACALLALVWI